MADPSPDTGKTWGIPNAIWNAFFLALMTAVLSWMQQRTKDAVEETGEKAAVEVAQVRKTAKAAGDKTAKAVNEVKETLRESTAAQDEKFDGITKTGEDIHTLVNSSFGAQLKLHAETARAKADITNTAEDKAVADLAEQMLREHQAKQRTVDGKSK